MESPNVKPNHIAIHSSTACAAARKATPAQPGPCTSGGVAVRARGVGVPAVVASFLDEGFGLFQVGEGEPAFKCVPGVEPDIDATLAAARRKRFDLGLLGVVLPGVGWAVWAWSHRGNRID